MTTIFPLQKMLLSLIIILGTVHFAMAQQPKIALKDINFKEQFSEQPLVISPKTPETNNFVFRLPEMPRYMWKRNLETESGYNNFLMNPFTYGSSDGWELMELRPSEHIAPDIAQFAAGATLLTLLSVLSAAGN